MGQGRSRQKAHRRAWVGLVAAQWQNVGSGYGLDKLAHGSMDQRGQLASGRLDERDPCRACSFQSRWMMSSTIPVD